MEGLRSQDFCSKPQSGWKSKAASCGSGICPVCPGLPPLPADNLLALSRNSNTSATLLCGSVLYSYPCPSLALTTIWNLRVCMAGGVPCYPDLSSVCLHGTLKEPMTQLHLSSSQRAGCSQLISSPLRPYNRCVCPSEDSGPRRGEVTSSKSHSQKYPGQIEI